MDKVATLEQAMSHIRSGQMIAVGGFGLVGCPLTLVQALAELDVRDLTIISNNIGESGKGLGVLLLQNKIKKAIGSYFTSNPDAVRYYNEGKLEIELVPQGTLAERLRAGGAGIGGFYTRTSVHTDLAKNKEIRVIDGVEYVLEYPLRPDVALIKAKVADRLGNAVYYKTAQNFNPDMAMAAQLTIVEAEEIVEVGEIDPDHVVTPHIFVDFVVESRVKNA